MTSGWSVSYFDRPARVSSRACLLKTAAGRNRPPARRVMARLTLVLFALRALVPAGYMPDLGSLEHGQVRIVICTGAGFQTVLVDEAGQPVDGQESGKTQHADDGCPFGTASAKAFVAPAPVVTLALPVYERHFQLPGSDVALLPPALGPPLGPRAPPAFLG